MKSKFNWMMILVLFFVVQVGFAQLKTVTGVVKDVDGYSVPGASVVVVGTQEGTSTDDNGAYSIKVKTGDRLEVSMMGYQPKTVTVGKSNLLNVTLAYDLGEELVEIVLDSYREISKPKTASSVSTVTSDNIEGRPNSSFVQTLQAQVPGLNISTGSGQPGSDNTSIILRGVGSINGNTEPLFVVDGVPMESVSFKSINANDIENVSVLKDAGATSIYGNRGANGVIVVTTKGASFESDLQVRYTGITKVSTMQDYKYNLMNSEQLIDLEKAKGINWTKNLRDKAIQNSFDWLGYFFNPAIGYSHTLSFANGSKNLSSYTSVGYTDEDGILKKTNLKRFTFRNNLNGKNKDGRLTYGTSLSASYSRSNFATSLGRGYINDNYVVGALKGLPYITPEMLPAAPNGFGWSQYLELYNNPLLSKDLGKGSLAWSPLLLVDKLNNFTSTTNELKIVANGKINYDLGKGFTAGTSLGLDYYNYETAYLDHPHSFNSWYFSDWNYNGAFTQNQEYFGSQTTRLGTVAQFNAVTQLNWSKRVDDHEFKAGAYLEYIRGQRFTNSLVQNGLYPTFVSLGSGTGWIDYVNDGNAYYVPAISQSKSKGGLFSYFGTFDYDYANRYGVSATVRRDASYRFAGSNRWGTFWSLSGRWNIDREAFMEDSAFRLLKLRASYGTSGNQDIAGTGLFGASSLFRDRYGLGSGYNNQLSVGVIGIPNPELSWETVAQANVGIDWEVWGGRFRGALDVYQKVTTDLYQPRPVSAIYGQYTLSANTGSLKNEGIETQFAVDLVKKNDLKVTLNVNGSYNKNTVVELPSEDGIVYDGGLTTMKEGNPIYEYYLVKYAGVNPANGNLHFYDKDGNLTEEPADADRVYTGKNMFPTMQGGFGLDVEYKGFFMNSLFSFATDVWRFDYDYGGFVDPTDIGTWNKSADLIGNYWTPTNTNAEFPALTASNTSYQNISDRNLKDASYVRLRYITLGYNFNQDNLRHLKLSGLRVYAQAENYFTWTKWKGFDAESNRRADQFQYPTPKTISLGLEVSF